MNATRVLQKVQDELKPHGVRMGVTVDHGFLQVSFFALDPAKNRLKISVAISLIEVRSMQSEDVLFEKLMVSGKQLIEAVKEDSHECNNADGA